MKREAGLMVTLVCGGSEVSFRPRGRPRRGGADWHQWHGQILYWAVLGAGERARVRQVRGGEQPPVLAAGAGLHPGAGGQ